ncbi:peptidoglycan/LPS O-acetylase OafA/YrhL [Dysgonomonas alginatilytica]|uniref:Peptidoglycan/LPS O-acetylase OafA/YrhL n=1 Tax=Dysgonomonas alginatilytica TaxID=1605892 RepID=A0A2V3PVN9_9BACT|nr:acyltransferase [Dysgonomonas alginatilytica]PXV68891.1 peptidoglycan/LPS O-acetylase OafA/YrhL [Dysgonomonas alginatilytica]
MGFLRFLFALAVVIAHSAPIFGYRLIPGSLAVQSFYMISGFYISLVLNEKYIGENKSYKLFLSNRVLRLYPSYWFVLLCIVAYSAFFMIFFNSGDSGITLSYYKIYFENLSLWSYLYLIFSNLFIFGQELVWFLGLDTLTGNLFFTSSLQYPQPNLYVFLFIPQAWTVSLELMFYVCAPFVVRRNITIVISIIVLSLLLRVLMMFNFESQEPVWSYRFFPTELALFLLGTVAYRISVFLKNKNIHKNVLRGILYFMILLTLSYSFIDFKGLYILFIVLFFISLPFIFIYTKDSKRDRKIGELSYPIYICHLFVLMFINSLSLSLEVNLWASSIVILSILFAYILYRFVDSPLNRYRQRRLHK